jgi:glycerophosphoryl diester phosphodiesterase
MSTMPYQRPLIIGHRGAAGEAPENTLTSFPLALEQGADMLELDVHLTKDSEIIVCHDETVNRTTNGSGAITDLAMDELQRLDAGSWFHERFAGERLPTLQQVFEQVPACIKINVEVKCLYSPALSDRLRELVQQYDRWDSVVLSGFSHKLLYQLKQDEPRFSVGLLYCSDFVQHRLAAEASGMPVYSLHPFHMLIQPEDIADLNAHGIQTYPYTVNQETHMRRLIDAGVSGIITDYPARLKELLEKYE